jgi:hypothetical protein
MITYLKNDHSVIKVDSETQSLTLITTRENALMVRHDYNNSPLFEDVTVTKYEQGVFVDATEEDFLTYKQFALSKLD